MFSQLAKRITSKTKDQRFLGRNKIMAVENGTILCRFPDIVCGLLFLLNNFPSQSLECAAYGL